MSTCCIVIPCFNEETRIQADRFVMFASSHRFVRFVFVNDGSSDATAIVLQQVVAALGDQGSVVSLAQNVGKAEAVRLGVLSALETAPAFFGYWDADLSTPLEAIDDFLYELELRDSIAIVLGSRVKLLGRRIERKFIRHCIGRMFATAISVVLGLPVYDTQCGAKIFRNSAITRALFEVSFVSRWLFDVEILLRFRENCKSESVLAGTELVELPLKEWIERPGSKMTVLAGLSSCCQLLGIALRTSRYSVSKVCGPPHIMC